MLENCPVCNKKCQSISIHLSRKNDDDHNKYLDQLTKKIDNYLLTSDLFVSEIQNKIFEEGLICPRFLIYNRIRYVDPTRKNRILSTRRQGNKNPVFQAGVIQKISDTIKTSWNNGKYDQRINGMLGKKFRNNPRFDLMLFLKWKYIDIYNFYHKNNKCLIEQCDQEYKNVHHIDENHSNFLLTNLEGFCVPHHMNLHILNRKPSGFVEITREFTFDSSHNLLNYIGKCARLHGHTYKLQVSLKKRICQESGMVLDFGILKEVVNNVVLEKIDHFYLNDIMTGINPTAENMLYWIWEKLEKDGLIKGLVKLKLWETPNSSAEITNADVLNSEYIEIYYNDMSHFYQWEE